MMGLPAHTRIKNPLGFQFFALGKEGFLESCGSRLMESNVKDELFLGHEISIPEPIELDR